MTTGSTATSIVNQALQQIAAQASVTGVNPTFDGSAAGNAAGILYTPTVNLLLRQTDYEFSRNDVALALSGVTAPYPWTYGYLYPADCLKIRMVKPASWNQNDPQPVRWTELEQSVSGTITRVIGCSVANAVLTYTTSNVSESEWDSIFQETFVRTLASELAMALGGRPDFSEKMLGIAGGLVGIGSGKDS
jgi:hypothetical protein